MKLKFKRETLSKTLLFVRNSLPKKEVEPILNFTDFRVLDANTVQIVSTDLDLMAVARCTCTVENYNPADSNELVIPGQRLLSLITRLTGEDIEFDAQGTSIFITCGAYKADFKTQSTENYPDVHRITEQEALVSFNRETLLAGFKRIDFAVNEDEAKKQLMAVQISRNGMVASNGKVTAIYREAFDVDELCISSNCLTDLIAVMSASAAETVQVFEEDAYLVFKFGEDLFFTRKTSVTFPEVFKRFDAPTLISNKEILKFKVKDLRAVLQRVSLTASEETRSVTLEVVANDTIKVSAKDTKDFYSEETLHFSEENLPTEGEPLKLSFNYDILLEILTKMAGEDIDMKMNSSNIRTPVRIDEGKISIFVMRSVL